MAKGVEFLLELLDNGRQLTIIGLPGAERAAFLSSIIQAAFSGKYDILVLDWYGNLAGLNLPSAGFALPYTAIRPYIHRALSTPPDLRSSSATLEAVITECVSEATNLQQALSSLLTKSSVNPASKLAYLRFQSILAYISDIENMQTHAYVDLSKIPILVRGVMLQLWIAFAHHLLLSNRPLKKQLLVVEEVGRALRKSVWVWDLIDEMTVRGVRLILTDQYVRRSYLNSVLVIVNMSNETLYSTMRFRIQLPMIPKRTGEAVVVDGAEHYTVHFS
ncbi:MAG: hypothetical protein QW291_06865 [Thermofilaceae archaeon]